MGKFIEGGGAYRADTRQITWAKTKGGSTGNQKLFTKNGQWRGKKL